MAAEDKLRDYLKRVTVDLTDTRKRLTEVTARQDEPIAVIGMSCRFPGADGVDAYWDSLAGGRSGVRDDVPDGRYELDPLVATHGVYTKRGAFLDDITTWDARFFGFPPREALRMDPQQRLLMELTWHALEDAGTPPASLAGSRTGVFVGFSDTSQYARLEVERQGLAASTDPYLGQGSAASVVAGRLAYHFDLRGPALALDTACSSSLVAVHLAAQALRRGEADLMVAGGAFLAVQPDLYVQGCATSMLSPAGRCATFDAGADGYVLGEGGGFVVLARLSDALKAGHRIRAVIRGSAVNQDGRSNGLTAPNRTAQVDVIRRALAAAKTAPVDVSYVEAHGSGTPLGDEIELGALGDVFGTRPDERPLLVGAVKTNIGHTQAAAGIAGLIKTVLVLEHGVVPPNLNQSRPADAALANTNVAPVLALADLPATDAPTVAGVSSFGWSGTNAHLVVEAAPAVADTNSVARPEVLTVSAADEPALRALLRGIAASAAGSSLTDLAYTLQSGRAEHRFRRAVVGTDPADAADVLLAAAAGEFSRVRPGNTRPTVAFRLPAADQPVCADLYADEPVYAAVVDGGGDPALVMTTAGYALAELLGHYGVRPDQIVGHGLEVEADVVVELAAADRADLMRICGRLWEAGVALDWTLVRGGRGALVGLTPYPFQRERYWIDAPVEALSTSDGPELLVRRWIHADDTLAARPADGRYTVIADAGGVADALAEHLRAAGAEVVVSRVGADLPDAPGTLVDLSALDTDDAADAVVTVAATLAALGANSATNTSVLVVTRGGVRVDTESVAMAGAAVAVLPVVANQEYLNLDVRGVDLDPAHTPHAAAAALAAELTRPSGDVLVAYRGDVRYLPDYQPADTQSGEPAGRAGGTYLITGGLGDIGLAVAQHLAAAGAARLILVSRSGLGADPADPADPRVIAVRDLRAAGVEVETPRVDVADPTAVLELLSGGRVDGVVHAAADTSRDAFRPLRDLDRATVARSFTTKVGGALVLAEVIAGLPADRRPDWCVLFSSTSALLGGVTFGGYAAANAALDALALRENGFVSVGWDTWDRTLSKLDGGIGATLQKHAMTDAQALAAFDAVLAARLPVVVVAAGGLTDRLPKPKTGTAPVRAPRSTVTHPRPDLAEPYTPPMTATERGLAAIWTEVLGIDPVGTRDNFFDLGGTSLLVPELFELIRERFGVALPTVTLFEAATVRGLGAVVDRDGKPAAIAPPAAAPRAQQAPTAAATGATSTTAVDRPAADRPELDRSIAIVGMAGRFPGAGDVAEFWRNLCGGVESISFFSTEELIASGVDPELVANPNYVPARPVLDDITGFDAAFFGMSPRMAALTDPQQRLFLEVCWEALEQSGYAQPENRGRVGVFGGTHISTYLLGIQPGLGADVSQFEIAIGNEKDALTTNVSYLFDLHGPSVAVQTFCSTSLVAAHLAVQSLRAGDCELAMAGGVSIRVPDKVGHVFEVGGMESPDGHVRTFDAKARGAMFGDGATVVVLKRFADALRDGDHIWGVIRGTAMNNDGAQKVGYTAPSVTGQAAVVAAAMADAGVHAEDIGYIEAHGSGTPLGDPIEVAALTQAFGPTADRQYCPIGSVKTNVGHLDRAAGTTGLIKTTLTLAERLIPPTLHFTTPNPDIDFAGSPFYVNTELLSWQPADGRKRIAGVNSLGMGGTNVHMVVEEPPANRDRRAEDDPTSRRYQVLPVSARTTTAADASCLRLGAHLAAHPDARLADAAYTLQVGRKVFEHRRTVVASSVPEAALILGGTAATAPLARVDAVRGRPVAFLFTGVGEQYPGLVGELYRREPAFATRLDDCLRRLTAALPDVDVADLLTGDRQAGANSLAALLGRGGGTDERTAAFERTRIAQPLLFAVNYALAATLMSWGIQPAAMLGYSLGEYVAACLAGVLSLDDAIAIVVKRAELIETVEAGAMAAVALSEDTLRARYALDRMGIDVAAVNGPEMTVVAGSTAAVTGLLDQLRAAEIPSRPLSTTHAFHSRMLAPLAAPLTEWITTNITLNAPVLPYFSNVTGGLADAALVCDPGYWAKHMCQTVRFAAGADAMLADPELAVVEIGPGQSLAALIRSAGLAPARWPLLSATLPAAGDPRPADGVLTDCVARLWLAGVDIDWAAYHGRTGEDTADAPGRIPLPTYPFERQRYWIDGKMPGSRGATALDPAEPTSFADIDRFPRLPEDEWLSLPVWRQTTARASATTQPASWLVYAAEPADGVLAALRVEAGRTGATVTVVRPGDSFTAAPDGAYTVRPGNAADALELLRGLRGRDVPLERVVHLWTTAAAGESSTVEGRSVEDRTVELGLHSLVALARAASEIGLDGWALDIVTVGSQQVLDGDEIRPAARTLIGPALVVPLEYPSVTTRLIDVESRTAPGDVVAELCAPRTEPTVALRGRRRWVCGYETVPAVPAAATREVLRDNGVYLITGGLGGIGLAMAEHLARDCHARLVLFGRRGLPPRSEWAAIGAGTADVDAGIRDRVTRVLEIIALGAEVEIVTGDVADAADVRRAVETATRRFGALHGVLHAAGVPGTGLMQFKAGADLDRVLAPKVAGARALDAALRVGEPDEVTLDFLALFSSITSATGGGPGQVDYCAANAFLDGYAAERAASGRPTVSVGWGEWAYNGWDDGLAGYDEELRKFFTEHRANFGITFEEGWRGLLRAVATAEPHLIVSTQDLPAMVALGTRFTVEAATAPSTVPDGERHPRPEMVTPYQEPVGPTQERLAETWCQTLRLQRIGVDDSFFDLGGNSLLGITMLGALRRVFPGAELPPHVLYEAPTVAALAKLIDGDSGASTSDTRVDAAHGERRRAGLKAAAARRRAA